MTYILNAKTKICQGIFLSRSAGEILAYFQRQPSKITEPKTATKAIGTPKYDATKRLSRMKKTKRRIFRINLVRFFSKESISGESLGVRLGGYWSFGTLTKE